MAVSTVERGMNWLMNSVAMHPIVWALLIGAIVGLVLHLASVADGD